MAGALALPAATLAGCGRTRDAGRLSIWAMDVEAENSKFILPAFTRATGLPVDMQWLAWTAAHQKLVTAYAGGSLPDVMMLARNWVAEFALLGAIAPIPASEAGLLADAYAPHDLAIAGRDYAVPWTLDVGIQYYRRDILARAGYAAPPPDLESWRAMLRAVKRVQGDGFATLMQLDWPDYLMHFAEQQEEPLLRDRQAFGNFRSAAFRATLAFYASLFAEGLAPRVSSIEAIDPPGDFMRGWVAVYNAGSWTRAELLRRRLLPRNRWAAVPLPRATADPRHTVAGAVLCVSPAAPAPARAWALIRYLTSPTTQLEFVRYSGTLPSRPSAWAAPVIARDPVMQVFRAAVDAGAPNRNLPEWDRITPQVQFVAERVVRGGLSIDEAVVEIDRRVDAILAKRRWLLERGRIA